MRRWLTGLTVSLLGCGGPSERCDVAQLARSAAVAGSRDCGVSEPDAPEVVAACVAAAFAEGVPFHGVVQEAGVDSLLVRAFVSDGRAVTLLKADFYACFEDGCAGRVEQLECPEPHLESVDGVDKLACTWTSPPCGTIVCGGDGDTCAD